MIIFEQQGKKDIVIIGRDSDRKRYVKRISDFSPYFYDNNKNKITVETPADIHILRGNYPKTYEADVYPYAQRYLIDRHSIPLPIEIPRVCCIDIETNKCLDTITTPEPILCITCQDSDMEHDVTFALGIEDSISKDEKGKIFKFKDKKEVILKFIEFIKDRRPELITGWNINGFDLPYIINFGNNNDIDMSGLSPFKLVSSGKRERNKKRLNIKGVINFDLCDYYRKMQPNKLGGYSLEKIAMLELNKQKHEPKDFSIKNIDEVISCCREHVALAVEIDQKKHIVEFYNNLRIHVGCVWSKLAYSGTMDDILLLRYKNDVLPTLVKTEKVPYDGAFVMKSEPGVHTGVIIFDLKRLYPSIICQFNMSFDTIRPGNLINGFSFSTDEGTNPKICKYLIKLRETYTIKQLQFKKGSKEYDTFYVMQYAIKRVANSIYGYCGFNYNRVCDYNVAGCITSMGQEIIKHTIKSIEDAGYSVIYGDTDSCFVETGLTDLNEILIVKDKLLKITNEGYNKFVQDKGGEKNEWISNEYKGIFKNVFFSSKKGDIKTGAKKRYAGWLVHDGKKEINYFDVSGFEIVKSNFNKFGKQIQEELLKMILDNKTKKECKEYINKKKEEIYGISINDIAIPTMINRPIDTYIKKTFHVEAAKWSNENLNMNIQPGDSIKYIYAKIKDKPDTKRIAYKDIPPKDLIINWEKMIEITIDNKTSPIFAALGWEEKSESLDKWMK